MGLDPKNTRFHLIRFGPMPVIIHVHSVYYETVLEWGWQLN